MIDSRSTCNHFTTFDNHHFGFSQPSGAGDDALTDRRITTLLIFWLLSLMPLAGTFLMHYPDERHYTDAALWMLETGDLFTPQAADGSHRFLKPILPYWVTSAPFFVFGIHILTARLGFLLAGVATIGLVWRCASELLGDRNRGFTAALIAASHVQLVFAAMRSIPDVLLVLFLTISGWGFMRLLLQGQRNMATYWLAWGGAGLAMASKGLLAVVFVGYVLAFASFVLRQRKWRDVIHLPAVFGGMILGTGWYGLMFILHGQSFWQVFWLDQVEEKIATDWYAPMVRIPLMAMIVTVNFLPWSMVAIEAWVRRRKMAEPEADAAAGLPMLGKFALGWAGVCCVVFGLGGNPSLRYVLPVMPLLAIFLAQWIHLHPMTTRRPLRGWTMVVAGVLFLTGLLLGLLNLQLRHWTGGLAVMMLGVLFAWAIIRELRQGTWSPATLVAVGMVLMFPIVFLGGSRVFLPDSATLLTRAVLAQQEPWRGKPLVYIGNPAVASKMRVVSGGTLRLGQLNGPPPQGLSSGVVYLLAPQHVLAVNPRHFEVQRIAAGYVNLPPGEFVKAVLTWRFADYLESHRQYFILAQPKGEGP